MEIRIPFKTPQKSTPVAANTLASINDWDAVVVEHPLVEAQIAFLPLLLCACESEGNSAAKIHDPIIPVNSKLRANSLAGFILFSFWSRSLRLDPEYRSTTTKAAVQPIPSALARAVEKIGLLED